MQGSRLLRCEDWLEHFFELHWPLSLFRYTGWRDTKLAIVMFVREKGLTAILRKAKATLEEHPQFVAWKDAASETELRATMHWAGDEERLADFNVFFVHTPQSKN